MSDAFVEGVSLRMLDPVDGRDHVDFDWPELERLLGEVGLDVPAEQDRAQLAAALRKILLWSLSGQPAYDTLPLVARRLVILAWCTDPNLFQGTPSLCRIAQSLGVNESHLRRTTERIRRDFGITNRLQRRHHEQ